MAMSSGEDEDNYWPGYVDALTTMTMVLTFILMVLGIVVFSLSQSVSRAYIDAIAEAAGLPHPKSQAESVDIVEQVVTLLRDKDKEAKTGGLAASGTGVENTSSKVVSDRAESTANPNPVGTSIAAAKERDGPAKVALAEPDPVYFARPTSGGEPADPDRISGERLTSATAETSRPESANRPVWDPKAAAGHLTTDSGEAPLALSGQDPARTGQPGTGEVPAREQAALATDRPGKAAVAGDSLPGDKPVASEAPAQAARVELAPSPEQSPEVQAGQAGPGAEPARDAPAMTSGRTAEAASTSAGAGEPASERTSAEPRATESPSEKPAVPAPGDKTGTDKAMTESGPAVAMLAPAPSAVAPPLSTGPHADDRTLPGGVPVSVRDKPNPDPSMLLESAMAPIFRQTSSGAQVTTAGAALTIRFKPRALTLTEPERAQLREFIKDLAGKGVREFHLEALATVSEDGFSDERRAAYSRMLIVRNELLAASVPAQAIHMKVSDSADASEANVVRIKRP